MCLDDKLLILANRVSFAGNDSNSSLRYNQISRRLDTIEVYVFINY